MARNGRKAGPGAAAARPTGGGLPGGGRLGGAVRTGVELLAGGATGARRGAAACGGSPGWIAGFGMRIESARVSSKGASGSCFLDGAAALGGAAVGAAGLDGIVPAGRMPANSINAFVILGVISCRKLASSLRIPRESRIAMMAPTRARPAFTARYTTADRESPRSKAVTGRPSGFEKTSNASRTALCSSGPIELSVIHSTSPFSSWSDIAWIRAVPRAARMLWQIAS